MLDSYVSQPVLLGGELFLIGFTLFVIIYILIRLLTERLEHSKHKMKRETWTLTNAKISVNKDKKNR